MFSFAATIIGIKTAGIKLVAILKEAAYFRKPLCKREVILKYFFFRNTDSQKGPLVCFLNVAMK
jgi:hypothetical protein